MTAITVGQQVVLLPLSTTLSAFYLSFLRTITIYIVLPTRQGNHPCFAVAL